MGHRILTKRELIERLVRRFDYLGKKSEERRCQNQPFEYLRDEMQALRWAIDLCISETRNSPGHTDMAKLDAEAAEFQNLVVAYGISGAG